MHVTHTKKSRVARRGFTLVETLVAVTILLVVITGPMTIASNGMKNAYYAGDQTTAVYLAQEAIEAVQRLRDNNALAAYDVYKTPSGNYSGQTTDWHTNLDSDCKNGQGCDVDFSSGSPVFNKDCDVTNECTLKVDIDGSYSNRVYGYAVGWTMDSVFTRRIQVGALSGGAVPVTVTVSWNANIFSNTPRSVVLQTYIYDQYKRYE
jgi:prepilin-type N-terminal cleavage/methylation domain-containing protein